MRPGDRKGFALITAILAIMILIALGFLAISVTTGDLKITSRVAGEKKALSAAETGIHRLMQNFGQNYESAGDRSNITGTQVTDVQVDSAADPASRYTISAAGPPPKPPYELPSPGSASQWVQLLYVTTVTGKNTNYNSSVQIDVGTGYGPVPAGTGYK